MEPKNEPQGGNRLPAPAGLNPRRKLRVGYMVFSALVIIKIGEYLIALAVRTGDWPFLAILASISAGIIIYYYKHIHQLWGKGKTDE